MDLFSLAARLTLDSSSFNKGVIDAKRSGNGLASSLESTFSKIKKFAAGAISVAAIKKGIDTVLDLAKATSDYGDKVDKQSQVLGLSRKAYQEWDYILGQNGASIDSMSVSMKTLNSLILSAAEGSEESKDAFAELGLGIHEIENLNPEEQFEAVVRAFQKLPAGANKSALAVKIFGKNGMSLLPLLNQSSDSIDELRQRAQELGIIMSDDAVDASVAYNDALDDMNRTFNALKYAVGSQLLPVFTKGVTKITNFAGRLVKAFNKDGVSGVFSVVSQSLGNFIEKLKSSDSPVLQTLGDSLSAIQTTIKIIGDLFNDFDGTVAKLQESDNPVLQFVGNSLSAIQKVFEWIIDNYKTVAVAVGAIVAAFASTKIAVFVASINPLTLVFTLIAMAIGLVATNWDKIKDWIGKAWNTTVTWVQNGWAVVSGAFKAAGAWISDKVNEIKLSWTSTVDGWITSIKNWLDGTGLSQIALNFSATVAEWIQRIYDWIQNGVDIAVNFFGDLFGGTGGVANSSSYDPTLGAETPWIPTFGEWDGYNAKGLNTVPYDNYIAKLHRGEQILTASQARKRNKGGFDTNTLSAAVAGAIREAMENVTVNSYLSGRDVTENVNRNTIREVKARRFAR